MILKRLPLIISILVLTLFAAGCASTSKAPESKSAEAKTFEAPADKGTVFLYRTGRFVGSAGQLMVKVNSLDAGGTGPGTFFRWDLKPGTYTFSSATGESSAVIQLEVNAGQVYFVRQDARMGIDSGRVTMKEVDAKKGENEVKNCKLLVSAYVPE
jgi:PBP1b-binding outer membrane lipoprotein LpoB